MMPVASLQSFFPPGGSPRAPPLLIDRSTRGQTRRKTVPEDDRSVMELLLRGMRSHSNPSRVAISLCMLQLMASRNEVFALQEAVDELDLLIEEAKSLRESIAELQEPATHEGQLADETEEEYRDRIQRETDHPELRDRGNY